MITGRDGDRRTIEIDGEVIDDRNVKVQLTGWNEEWPQIAESVMACVFGAMVSRSVVVTEHYRSDLFHDATWMREKLQGWMTFDWLVREWGTNIAESARVGVEIGAGSKAVFYRIKLLHERGMWYALFTTVPLDEVPGLPRIDYYRHWHTDNGVRITPGLRVFTNEYAWATVDAEQFEPGGKVHDAGFDGWFYVTYEPDQEWGQGRKAFNGERLSTRKPS